MQNVGCIHRRSLLCHSEGHSQWHFCRLFQTRSITYRDHVRSGLVQASRARLFIAPRHTIRNSDATHIPLAASKDAPSAGSRIHPTLDVQKPILQVPPQDQRLVDLLLYLCRLSGDVQQVVGGEMISQGLELVTTSAICEVIRKSSVVATVSEDYEAGDGMVVPLFEVKQQKERIATGPATLQSRWTPTESGFEGIETPAAGCTALEQINAYQDQQQMLRDQQRSKLASGISTGISRLAPTVTSLASTVTSAVTNAARPVRRTVTAATQATVSATKSAACATIAAVKTLNPSTAKGPLASEDDEHLAAASRQLPTSSLATPESDWLVCDDPTSHTRHFVIHASPSLASLRESLGSDLVAFEDAALGTRINSKLYTEATALYSRCTAGAQTLHSGAVRYLSQLPCRFLPLVLEHLEEGGGCARVCFAGSGVGGCLATVLVLMLVRRGITRTALAPVFTFNSPAALCEVPDFDKWCGSKHGCSVDEVNQMVFDLVNRGILSELGLRQDAVKNVYLPASAAKQQADGAVAAVASFPELVQGWFGGGSKLMSSGSAVPQQPSLVSSSSSSSRDPRQLQVCCPIGQILMYSPL